VTVADRLQVILAGHNGDLEVLRTGRGEFTPESLSAAYARISRSPDPVPVLRERAREEVQKARASNRTIVFGLGHHSVAEHAVLNFDILGCSRLAIEALEWHRLCSYTEKSQRYITLDGDFVVPAELEAAEVRTLTDLVGEQNRCYADLLPVLHRYQQELHPEMLEARRGRTVVEGWAKEDARYAVSLATEGQLGLTCNARSLEHVIRRLRTAPLDEVRTLGQQLFDAAREVVPSLIVLADEEAFREAYGVELRDRYFRDGGDDLKAAAALVEVAEAAVERRRGDVTLLGHTADPDAAVLSALLFAAGRGSAPACVAAARRTSADDRRRVLRRALINLSEYDAPPRAFEEAVFSFEIVVDASAMAQLKRHRMATQIWGPYDPGLGVTVPPAIEAVGEVDVFDRVMVRAAAVFDRLQNALEGRGAAIEAAAYALTNAHRRRVRITMNLRDIYHFVRLREDRHAQWAIRRIAADLRALVSEAAPASSLLLCGKDGFADLYERVMA
jgi:flavin-dependent thymidylate synthase